MPPRRTLAVWALPVIVAALAVWPAGTHGFEFNLFKRRNDTKVNTTADFNSIGNASGAPNRIVVTVFSPQNTSNDPETQTSRRPPPVAEAGNSKRSADTSAGKPGTANKNAKKSSKNEEKRKEKPIPEPIESVEMDDNLAAQPVIIHQTLVRTPDNNIIANVDIGNTPPLIEAPNELNANVESTQSNPSLMFPPPVTVPFAPVIPWGRGDFYPYPQTPWEIRNPYEHPFYPQLPSPYGSPIMYDIPPIHPWQNRNVYPRVLPYNVYYPPPIQQSPWVPEIHHQGWNRYRRHAHHYPHQWAQPAPLWDSRQFFYPPPQFNLPNHYYSPPDGYGYPPAQGRQSPPAQGNQLPPVQGNQSPPLQGGQSPPVQGKQLPPLQGGQSPPVQGRQSPPVQGRQSPLVQGKESLPAQGRQSPPVQGNQLPSLQGGQSPLDEPTRTQYQAQDVPQATNYPRQWMQPAPLWNNNRFYYPAPYPTRFNIPIPYYSSRGSYGYPPAQRNQSSAGQAQQVPPPASNQPPSAHEEKPPPVQEKQTSPQHARHEVNAVSGHATRHGHHNSFTPQQP